MVLYKTRGAVLGDSGLSGRLITRKDDRESWERWDRREERRCEDSTVRKKASRSALDIGRLRTGCKRNKRIREINAETQYETGYTARDIYTNMKLSLGVDLDVWENYALRPT